MRWRSVHGALLCTVFVACTGTELPPAEEPPKTLAAGVKDVPQIAVEPEPEPEPEPVPEAAPEVRAKARPVLAPAEPVVRVKLKRTLKHRGDVFRVEFSPSGSLVASASNDGSIKTWKVSSGKLVRSLRGHSDGVTGVAWSPDEATLASASFDGSVRAWNAGTGKQLWKRDFGSRMRAVSFRPQGEVLVAAGDGVPVTVLSAADGQTRFVLAGSGQSVSWEVKYDPSGEHILAMGGGRLRVWSAEDGSPRWGDEGGARGNAVWAADFSADGLFVVAPVDGDGGSRVAIWESATGTKVASVSPADAWLIPSAAWSSRGFFAAGEATGRVSLWDPQQSKPVAEAKGLRSNVIDLSFSPDGLMLAGSGYDNVVKLWAITVAP